MPLLRALTVPVAMASFAGLYAIAIKFPGVVEFCGIAFWGLLPVIVVLRVSCR